MAASAKPRGSAPATKDVNPSVSPSTTEAVETPEPEAPALEAKEPEAELEENDLDVLDDQKKVPYSRFKEVNEKAKAVEQQLRESQQQFEQRLQREIENAELRIKAKFEQEKPTTTESLDPYEARDRELERNFKGVNQEVSGLKEQLAQMQLKSELVSLQQQYPKADVEAVLGWKRSKPHADLGELMERSHNRTVEMAKSTVQEILEQKKQKAKAAIPSGASGIRLKDSEKPKSLEEAKSLVRKLFIPRNR